MSGTRNVPTGAIRESIRGLVAYPIEHERVTVKLDANELGLELPSAIVAAFAEAAARIDLRRYPEGHADRLVAAVAERWGVPPESVLVGNGSNEMIALLFAAFAGPPSSKAAPVAVLPSPSFGVYPIQAKSHGFEVREVPLGAGFALDADALLATARETDARLIMLATPNNPTGNAFERGAVERILEEFDGPVVIDEAYQPFARDHWLGCWSRWPNAVVLRTLSKVGLAALRIGFLFADPRLTGELRKAKLPFNLNAVSAAVGEAAIRCWPELEAVAAEVVRERQRLAQRLGGVPGVEVFPSEANFVLVRVPGNADSVQHQLLERGISVRNFSRKPALAGCLRITIGKPAENDALVASLSDVLRS